MSKVFLFLLGFAGVLSADAAQPPQLFNYIKIVNQAAFEAIFQQDSCSKFWIIGAGQSQIITSSEILKACPSLVPPLNEKYFGSFSITGDSHPDNQYLYVRGGCAVENLKHGGPVYQFRNMQTIFQAVPVGTVIKGQTIIIPPLSG